MDVEVKVEVNEEEEGWKRSGSATVTAGDEEAAGGGVRDFTSEWGRVGGMGPVEGA